MINQCICVTGRASTSLAGAHELQTRRTHRPAQGRSGGDLLWAALGRSVPAGLALSSPRGRLTFCDCHSPSGGFHFQHHQSITVLPLTSTLVKTCQNASSSDSTVSDARGSSDCLLVLV